MATKQDDSTPSLPVAIPEPPDTRPGDPPKAPKPIATANPGWSLLEAIAASEREAKSYSDRFDAAVAQLESLLPELRVAFSRDEVTRKGIFMMGDAMHIWMQIETSQPKSLIEMLEACANVVVKEPLQPGEVFTKDTLFGIVKRAYSATTKRPAESMPVTVERSPADRRGSYPTVLHAPTLDRSKLS